MESNANIRPDVLNYDDIRTLISRLDGHPKLVNRLLRWLEVDEVNRVHGACCDTPGPEFVRRLLFEQFNVTLDVKGQEVLDHLPEGAFITVSNHPLGALDGIALIYLITRHRPEFKVMVNMILNKISAMRPNFIAVDAWASKDPDKRAVSIAGIRTALKQLRDGNPVGFFPAGAMSKTTLCHGLQDRPWQESILQIIAKAKVPVIPIYFHDKNSTMFDILGHICWPARSLRLPHEVFRKRGTTMHISVGQPISPEEQLVHGCTPDEPGKIDPETLGAYLRERTYALK